MHSKHEPHLLINLADCFHVHCLSLWCIHCNSFTHEFFLWSLFCFSLEAALSGDIKVMFTSVGRTTFQCLHWSLGEGILSERERGIWRGRPSFFGRLGAHCHSNLYIFFFIMQFYLKRDYNTLKEVFHINTVITYSSKTYILFSFGKLPSS